MELRGDSSKAVVKRETTSSVGKRKRESNLPQALLASTVGNNQVAGLVREVIESHTCPITHSLMVQPVLAEDGHLYEKRAIEKWFERHRRSPKTNESMSTKLVESLGARQIVERAVASQAVDRDTAAVWHCGSGRLKVSGSLLGGMAVAMNHFEAALKLSPDDTNAKLLKEAALLQKSVDDLLQKAEDSKIDLSCFAFQKSSDIAKARAKNLPMTEWKPLTEGVSVVRIIDNIDLLRDLCNRPAPGALNEVDWVSEMSDIVGKEFTISANDEDLKAYDIDDYAIPFDACILVKE